MIYENQYYKDIIEAVGNAQSMTKIITDIIEANGTRDNEMIALWDRYSGNVAIKNRTFTDTTKPNNKLVNDYRGVLIQQIVGYLFGNPVKYQLDPVVYADKYIEYDLALQTFLKRNNYEELDASMENYLAVCGKSFRLCFYADIFDATAAADEKIELIMKNIRPWEATIIRNPVTDEIDYGMIYYDFDVVDEKGKVTTLKRIEWYDKINVYYYIQDDKDYVEDYLVENAVQVHQFNYVPLVEFANNALYKGDFEKIESLIDAMDIALSDSVNDLENFSNAYLAFFGVEPDSDMLKSAKSSGAFYVPRNSGEDSANDVKFITKDINPDYFKELVNILNDRIWKFAAGVDMSDESFSGAAQTGVSRRYKLFGLEIKAREKERLYVKSLRDLFKVLTSFWISVKNIQINYEDIKYIFTRYIPTDLSVQELVMLRGVLSDEAILSTLPSDVVPNVQVEMARVVAQNAAAGSNISLDNIGTAEVSEPTTTEPVIPEVPTDAV